MRGKARALLALVASVIVGPLIAPSLSLADEVRLLTVQGIINPVTSRYLKRELEDSERSKADAVVISLDTPGGLESSMREIVQAMLKSPVPVIVYVSPPGARAASAGMFITIAGHVAAMAPGTNIGAAHPVAMGARNTDDRGGRTLEEKSLNDAAALARSIAVERGRNTRWIEDSVRKSVSISAAEALDLHVIDLRAADLDDLLRKLNGRVIQTSAGRVQLNTERVRIVDRPMALVERLLQAATDPNIAYILLTIGFIGIIAELYHPGMILPGAVGVLSLLLGYVALGSLPINWVGIFLIALGLGFLITELHAPTLGALGTVGLVAFILGSIMLYRPILPSSPAAMPGTQVSPVALVAMSLSVAAFFFGVLRAAWSARRRAVSTGPEALIGSSGIAESDLDPAGVVNLRGERWSAEIDPSEESEPSSARAYPGPRARSSSSFMIRKGERVEVRSVNGVIVRVRRKK